MKKLFCCIEVGPDYAPKARYALQMLLEPIGLSPIWVQRVDLNSTGVYYGQTPQGLPAHVIVLHMGLGVEAYFEQQLTYPIEQVRWRNWRDLRYPVLFGSGEEDDWVASTFFWLAGWQEYVSSECDMHGRFPHKASIQHKLGITGLPVVDVYRKCLQERLEHVNVRTAMRKWGASTWALCPTIDVDYLRKWRKGMIYRELVEYFLLNHQRSTVRQRMLRLGLFVRSFLQPRDVFRVALERMHVSIRQYGTGTIFLKTAAHGPQDVHYSLDTSYVRNSVSQWMKDGFEIGLHPSYHAHTHPEYLRAERATLTRITGMAPISVRQHYLRFTMPSTPNLHLASGFRIDSTLGFAEAVGFRHSTCLPFKQFNIYSNRTLDLWEFPLTVMDSTLFNRQKLTVSEAIDKTKDLLQVCARFGGAGVLLWHNILWDEMDFPGWGQHFEEVIQWGAGSGAGIVSLVSALSDWLGYPVGTERLEVR